MTFHKDMIYSKLENKIGKSALLCQTLVVAYGQYKFVGKKPLYILHSVFCRKTSYSQRMYFFFELE